MLCVFLAGVVQNPSPYMLCILRGSPYTLQSQGWSHKESELDWTMWGKQEPDCEGSYIHG